MDTRDYLEKLTSQAVRAIAANRGVPAKGAKDEIIEALAPRLLDRGWLERNLAWLDPEERDTLEAVRAAGGRMTAPDLRVALIAAGVGEPDTAIRKLMASALLFYSAKTAADAYGVMDLWNASRDYGRQVWNPELVLPDRVAEVMGPPVQRPPEPPVALEPAPGPLTPAGPSFSDAIRTLYILAQYIQERGLDRTQAGYIRKPDLARMNKLLPRNEPLTDEAEARAYYSRRTVRGRSDFLFALLAPLGLVAEKHGLISAREDAFTFFSLPPAEQARRMRDAWVEMSWDDLNQVQAFETRSSWDGSQDAPDAYRIEAARRVVLSRLRSPQAAAGWVTLASFRQAVRSYNEAFLYSRRTTTYSRDGSNPYGGIRRPGMRYGDDTFDKNKDWDEVEGAFITTMLREPLQWLGIVQVGLDAAGEIAGFRLTPEGAAALGLDVERPAGEEAPRGLVVQPNFEMVLLPDVTGFGAALELDRFAERVKSERAIIYRLTRESVYGGLRAGVTGIPERLEALSQTPLPQNVRHTVEEWAAQYAGLRLHREITVVTAGSPSELQETLRAAGVTPSALVPPAAALVPKAAGGRIAGRPGALGCDYGTEPQDVLRIEEPARIQVAADKMTPYLRYRLERFARPAGTPGAFTPDAERVRRTTAAGVPVAGIEEFLEGAAVGEVPARLRMWLRGWAGAYREAAMAPVVAFTAPSELLDLAMADAELQAHFLSRPAPTLALVEQAGAAAVRAAIEEAGVSVGEQLAAARPTGTDALLAGTPPLYPLPSKETRLLLERAIADKRDVVVAYLPPEANRVDIETLKPLELTRSGSWYRLQAETTEGDGVTRDLRRIQALRLVEG